jgi:hypothetical protein
MSHLTLTLLVIAASVLFLIVRAVVGSDWLRRERSLRRWRRAVEQQRKRRDLGVVFPYNVELGERE